MCLDCSKKKSALWHTSVVFCASSRSRGTCVGFGRWEMLKRKGFCGIYLPRRYSRKRTTSFFAGAGWGEHIELRQESIQHQRAGRFMEGCNRLVRWQRIHSCATQRHERRQQSVVQCLGRVVDHDPSHSRALWRCHQVVQGTRDVSQNSSLQTADHTSVHFSISVVSPRPLDIAHHVTGISSWTDRQLHGPACK